MVCCGRESKNGEKSFPLLQLETGARERGVKKLKENSFLFSLIVSFQSVYEKLEISDQRLMIGNVLRFGEMGKFLVLLCSSASLFYCYPISQRLLSTL